MCNFVRAQSKVKELKIITECLWINSIPYKYF